MIKKKSIFLICLFALVFLFLILSYINYSSTISLIANIISLILLIVAAIYYRKNNLTKISEFLDNKKWFYIIFWAIALVAILVRVILFVYVPAGLNVDEASMLYDAYSLLHYGIDRNGHSYPIYLEAWGSGQSALLAYLTIPFIAIFGMNVFSARIVMLLFSIGGIFAFYNLIKLITKNKFASLIGMAVFSLVPYTIMISRWGLDCNLFPYMFLFSIIFLIKANDNQKFMIPACILFGITLYTYAISYIFIPLVLIVIYIYWIVKKRVNWKYFIISNILLFLFALPLILFLMVNYGWIEEIHIGAITIPKLSQYRVGEVGFSNFFKNLIKIPLLFFTQNDGFTHNSIYSLGIMYIVMFPIMIYGIIVAIKNIRKEFNFSLFVFLISLLIGLFITLLIYKPNINKINIIWIPYIVFLTYGFYYFVYNSKQTFILTAVSVLLLFITFCSLYFSVWNKEISSQFNDGLMESISYANQIAGNELIYFSDEISEPYIYCLIVDSESPEGYLNTRIFLDNYYRKTSSYNNYRFLIDITTISDNKTYIMPLDEYNSKFSKNFDREYKVFENFVVIY